MTLKCCMNCGHRYHIDDSTVRCWNNPGGGVEPNGAGIYIFTVERAKRSVCESHSEEFTDTRYAVMDYNSWIDTFHADLKMLLRKQYDDYVEMMKNLAKSDEVYIVSFQYDDVGGMLDTAEIKYTDCAEAIKAAVRESERPGNSCVQLRHEWYDKQYRRKEGEWIDWKKEVNDGQAV